MVDSDPSAVVARRTVYGGAVVFGVVLIAAAVVSYRAYDVARLDLGDMVQAIWSTSHGRFLEYTTPNGHQASRLGAHVDPFLVLLVPFWWAWSSPLMLTIVQIVAVASGALPVYWLARKHLDSPRAGAHLALAYLLYPATQYNAFTVSTGIHAVSFAVPLILFAIWFLDADRLLPFAAFGLLAASTKEEIAAAVGCLGIWYAVRRRHWWVGAAIFVVGGAISLVDFLVIIPRFSPTGIDPYARRYHAVGGTPGGIARKLFSDPVALVHAAFTGHKVLYLGLLFIPILGLCLLEPLLLLGAVPDLVINLLSAEPAQTSLSFQYTAGIVPFVFAAAAIGTAKLKRRADGLSLAALLAIGTIVLLYSPVRFSYSDLAQARSSNPLHAAKAHALRLIPAAIPVSASDQLGALLSDRRFIYLAPHVGDAQWVIADLADPSYPDVVQYRRAIHRLAADPRWRLVFASHGIRVFNRRAAQPD